MTSQDNQNTQRLASLTDHSKVDLLNPKLIPGFTGRVLTHYPDASMLQGQAARTSRALAIPVLTMLFHVHGTKEGEPVAFSLGEPGGNEHSYSLRMPFKLSWSVSG